jgi:hypothetical protein
MPVANKKSKVTKPKSDTKPAVHASIAANDGSTVATPVTPTGESLIFVKPPPSTLKVPSPPRGFIAASTAEYRGLLPRKSEVAVLSEAVNELLAFTDYTQIFGRLAPPAATVAQILDAAGQWSALCGESNTFNAFCRSKQGLAWKGTRTVLTTMKAAFSLAVAADPSIATNNPNLVTLFGIAKSSAQRGADVRKANEQDEAAGKVPTHGKANQQVARAAATLAKANAHATPAPKAVVATAAAAPTTSAPGLVVSPALDGAAVAGSAANGGSH